VSPVHVVVVVDALVASGVYPSAQLTVQEVPRTPAEGQFEIT
jgi:hypothetical protein